ncbi:hypothetical protein H9I45_10030 [Polaribacter haliotis]|uniref:GlsB/YeaQ/YmgE family stress response membrane protein n=2 Tax=Polaribacter TaxID=52959 RepID=A0A7L8ACG4_9FLAO|nr:MULTISPECIES: hypothetical protein [Polaribacter]QNM85161.1 hypothetical protein H9W90_13330 [Polaribacter pectinis]QOD59695.1 hypothetical protein H9I45_10030 [Polaribacter haliotis]
MTQTLISLISILLGIIGANLIGFIVKKYSFGLVGNTISGVFGSIFVIKSFGRFGFSPAYIIENGIFDVGLLIINCVLSFLGGILGLLLIKIIDLKMNKKAAN